MIDPIEADKELIKTVSEFSHDPLGYVSFAFPWGQPGELEQEKPRLWQRDILNTIGKHLRDDKTRTQPLRIAIASGHGIGKSALVAFIIKWGLDTCEDCKIVVTAGTEAQLLKKTWSEVAKWNPKAITADWFTHAATSLHSTQKSKEKIWRADATTWSEHNSDAFAGLHNKGKRIIVIFDEASAIADKIWEVTEGALTDMNTEIIWIAFGNPTRNSGRFRECFSRYAHRWVHKQIDSRTVEGVNLTEINKLIEDNGIDSDVVKVRVRGMFPLTSFKQFINAQDVDAAYDRHLRVDEYSFAPKIISVEPAWTGDDPLVISIRQGLHFRILRVIPKNDNDIQIANIVAQIEDEEQADAVIVDGGFGTGIISAGKTMGRKWMIVWFSQESPDEGCLNMRAHMWNKAKQWMKEGGALPPDMELHDELLGPETVARMDGKIQLESKEDMKRRGLRSPNKADALAISFAYEIKKRDRSDRNPGQRRRPTMATTEMNPYA